MKVRIVRAVDARDRGLRVEAWEALGGGEGGFLEEEGEVVVVVVEGQGRGVWRAVLKQRGDLGVEEDVVEAGMDEVSVADVVVIFGGCDVEATALVGEEAQSRT